ncbi:MAG: hypothetical protein V1696_00585 [Candidatus Jorgensenbacteria bacterium]
MERLLNMLAAMGQMTFGLVGFLIVMVGSILIGTLPTLYFLAVIRFYHTRAVVQVRIKPGPFSR